MQALMEVVRGEEFRAAVDAMGGYGTARTGEVIWEYDVKQRTAG